MTWNVLDGQGAQALDYNTLLNQLRGQGVIEGGEVVAHPANRGGDHIVRVRQTAVYIGGTRYDAAAQDIDLEPYIDDEDPLKALIIVDETGTLDVVPGRPEEARPSNQYRFDTYRPAPPDLSGEPVVPLAEVWLSPDNIRTTDADIQDRGVSANIDAYSLDAEVGDFGEIVDGAGVSHTGGLADLDALLSEEDIRNIIDTDPGHATDAPHNYFSGSHIDLADVATDQHHPRYTDIEARSAVRGEIDPAELAPGMGTVGQHLEYRSTGLEWSDPPQQRAETLATGTVTHTGGSSTTVLIAGVTASETAEFSLSLGVASDPTWTGDYSYSYDYNRVWNDTTGAIDIELTLTWATDPGLGNDLALSWTLWDTTPAVVEGRWTDADTITSLAGSTIEPATAFVGDRLNVPVVDNLRDIPSPTVGFLAIASGNGADPFGQYLYNGTEWVGPLGTSVSALSDINVDVAKDWNGHPIHNVGAPVGATDVARVQEMTDHAAVSDAHHAKTTSAEVDHALVSNVQPDQHHSRPDAGEMAAAVSGRVHSVPLTAATIPSGEFLRNYIPVGTGEQLRLVRAEFFNSRGETPTGLTLQLYNRNDGTVAYEQTRKLRTGTSDSPLAAVSENTDLEARIRNATGSPVSAGGSVSYYYR